MSAIPGMLVAGLVVCAGPAEPSKSPDGIVYSQQQAFRIPLDLSENERGTMKGVRLLVSEDQGQSWRLAAEAPAGADVLTYRAERDGVYWFGIALVDRAGKQTPAELSKVEAGLKIVVDSQKPQLVLKPIKSKSGHRGVKWEFSDPHLDPASFQIAIWDQKANSWQSRQAPGPERQILWFDETEEVSRIQALVRDRAGNETIEEVEILGEQFTRRTPARFALAEEAVAAATPIPTAVAAAADETIRPVHHTARMAERPELPDKPANGTGPLCGSSRVAVHYAVEDVGPAGVGRVILWGTQDSGRTWVRLAVDEDKTSPVEATVGQEGTWGFLVTVSSAAGTDDDAPPKAGSVPDMTIEVDTVAPYVDLSAPEIKGDLVIFRWTAMDRNLAPTPVGLFAAIDRNGPWQRIAEKLDNSGEYLWNFVRANSSGKFYFRIAVQDRAGNTGAAETAEPVVLDCSKPKGRVVKVQPLHVEPADEVR